MTTSNQNTQSGTLPFFRWLLPIVMVSAATGTTVALFLWLLDVVTRLRWQHNWLLFMLPAGGVLIYYAYKLWGSQAIRGNNLVLDEIHQPGGGVPLIMAPLVLFTSVVTHVFGGSAGREGTAVQIGGSFAGIVAKKMKLTDGNSSILLKMGIAAGFGAVFGTPLAATIFALEVPYAGKIKLDGWLQCLAAAFLAHGVCSVWGIRHTHYEIGEWQEVGWLAQVKLLFVVLIAGALFGLVARIFTWLTHTVGAAAAGWAGRRKALVPVAGGVVVILLSLLPGGTNYLGLGVTTPTGTGASIVNAFTSGGVPQWAWLLKVIFTAVTLGTGYKGGEVTPLFFIGATLGNAIAGLANMPAPLFAALGFIGVFAAAANTPLACVLMGVELFGPGPVLYFAVGCVVAWYCSGHTGIYQSQRIGIAKRKGTNDTGKTIKAIRERNQKI